jgi:hypothetical protein
MDFKLATRRQIEDLYEKYHRVKKKHDEWDFSTRERNVKKLLREQEEKGDIMSRLVLVEYITQEVLPVLEHLDGVEKEIVRQYFRFISKQQTIYPGFILPPPGSRR